MFKRVALFAVAFAALCTVGDTQIAVSTQSIHNPGVLAELIEREVNVADPRIDLMPKDARMQMYCGALAAYHEARGEPALAGDLTVVVVRNRMRERGLTACQTVMQAYQFSWSSRPVSALIPREPAAWARALRSAYAVLHDGALADAKFNHMLVTQLARPSWMHGGKITHKVGSTTFLYIPPR